MGQIDPMCELFPKQVGCYYSRYGMGGGLESRHAMCILGLNMINDKVFLVLWAWQYFMILLGVIRVINRLFQVLSAKVRFFLIKLKMLKYFRRNAHMKHIQHFIIHCSIGDWFVLYQMSKNLNQRFFAEFLALLAMTVDPDPNIEPEEPEINLSPEDIEKLRSNAASTSSGDSHKSGDEDDEDEDDKDGLFARMDDQLDGGEEGGGGDGGGLTGKQRNLIKLGKHAKSSNKKAMMAAAAMRRKR